MFLVTKERTFPLGAGPGGIRNYERRKKKTDWRSKSKKLFSQSCGGTGKTSLVESLKATERRVLSGGDREIRLDQKDLGFAKWLSAKNHEGRQSEDARSKKQACWQNFSDSLIDKSGGKGGQITSISFVTAVR